MTKRTAKAAILALIAVSLLLAIFFAFDNAIARYGGQSVVISSLSGNRVSVNSDGQMHVLLMGKVCETNSSVTPLGIGGVFNGTSVDTLDYGFIFVTVFSDVASAVDGFATQISSDGVTWRDGDYYTIPPNTEKTYAFQPNKRYFRISYTNGGTEQATFDIQTIFKKTSSLDSSHRIQDSISSEDDSRLVKSILTAKNPNEVFVNIEATGSGNLRTTDAESGLAIAKGDVTDTTFIHKFGNAKDFDATDGIVTVWDGADDGGIDEMVYTYSVTADIDSLSSSAGGDTQNVEVQGLDTNFALVTQTITLTGQTRKALDTDLIRVFRIKNVGATDNAGTIYCYVNTALSSGVPIDTTKIRALVHIGNNQTLMAIYTIPAGKTGYMRDWFVSIAGANKTSNYPIKLRARPFGQVFQLKHTSSLSDIGTSYQQHRYEEPEIFTEKTDIEIRIQAIAVGVTAASISAGFDIVLIDN